MTRSPSRRFSISEARRELPTVVRLAEKGVVVELTRRGRPVAVLLSTRAYAGLTGGSASLWEAAQEFRRSFDLKELDIDDVYRDVRDRTPGRSSKL
ncbi:MAG: type II toxin-antitoxin system Phd/YefM family antitoxin [Planctomycetota bacterium]|jgi:prevent-host-death family protein